MGRRLRSISLLQPNLQPCFITAGSPPPGASFQMLLSRAGKPANPDSPSPHHPPGKEAATAAPGETDMTATKPLCLPEPQLPSSRVWKPGVGPTWLSGLNSENPVMRE